MARLVSSGWQTLGSLNTLLPVGLGLDQAGIDGKALAADQTFLDATAHHRLEQAAQQITLAETPVAVLREGRVIGHLAIEAKPTKPAISQVEVHLLAQPSFGANARAVTNQQHPDQQLGIDRRPTHRAIEWRQPNP